jgi:TP53 regulating kinase-like protein
MLIKKGAEASIYLVEWHGHKVIRKHRLPKKYRLPKIDERLRTYRTIHEAQLIHSAKKAGVPTPLIYQVDLANSNITMEFIEGSQVKQILDQLSSTRRGELSTYIGGLIGRLHIQGLIHGDLTTSNMILTPTQRVVFIDFGLGEISVEDESKGVDLHLMKRAFQSTHFRFAKECFEKILHGYSQIVGAKQAMKMREKILEIEKRGRYISKQRRGRRIDGHTA